MPFDNNHNKTNNKNVVAMTMEKIIIVVIINIMDILNFIRTNMMLFSW